MNVSPPGSLIGGRFEVAGRPLMGGMGVVYLCNDLQEDHPVALKTFRPELLPNRAARDRFLREGTHWVDLGDHPHVVRCYEVVYIGDGTEVYLVLEMVAKEEGRADASLRSWLAPGRPLSPETALLFALQAARAMAHAVATIPGFVHRDLKPENLLVGADRLPGESAANRLRVTDFGLVRALGSGEGVPSVGEHDQLAARPGLTRAGRILGTLPYMAPEQWAGPDVDLRADIYALGCILGEMLCGRMLVREATLDSYRQAHQGGRAAKGMEDLPAGMASVLGHCVAVEPTARYGSWGEVEAAVAAAYRAMTGRSAPAPEPAQVHSHAERMTAAWSYDAIGQSYLDIGHANTALGYFERVRSAGASVGDRRLESSGLHGLGRAHGVMGDGLRAVGFFEQALAIARQSRDQGAEGRILGNLGLAYTALGDARRAIGYHERALAIAREIGDRRGEGSCLGGLGLAYVALGDARRAIDNYEQALAIACEGEDRTAESKALGNLGVAYKNLGDARRAIGYHERHLALAREIGDRSGEGNALGNMGVAYLCLGDTRRAIQFYEQSWVVCREVGDRFGEATALGNLGSANLELGQPREALRYLELALPTRREIGDRHGESLDLGNLGNAYADLGDARRAISYYEQALAIGREIGDRHSEAYALANLGLLHAQLGEFARAHHYWTEALPILEAIEDPSAARLRSMLKELGLQ